MPSKEQNYWLEFFLIFLFCLGIGFATSAAAGSKLPQVTETKHYNKPEFEYLAKYKKAMLKGDYEGAEKAIREGISKYPGFAPYYYNLALILIETGRHQEARITFEKFIELDPDASRDPSIRIEMRRYGIY